MASVLLLLLFFTISPPSVTSYSYTDFITASVGSSVTLSCHSMFVTPHWRWTSAKAPPSVADAEMILSLDGLAAHPNVTNDRWHFKKSGFCHYKIKIADLQHCDAETFVCEGAANYTTYLNVVR